MTNEFIREKAGKIVSALSAGKHLKGTLQITIQDVKEIEGGIEVYASAKRGTKAIGFGHDGTVEIERFQIFNPPTLVDSLTGTITRNITMPDGTIKIRKLKEDPKQAIIDTIEHNISVVGKDGSKIIKGKVGQTTATFYPDANPETSSVDGHVFKDGGATWAASHDAAAGAGADDSGAQFYAGASLTNSSSLFAIFRGFTLFDTSSLTANAVISSATASVYPTNTYKDDNDAQAYIAVVQGTTASNTALAVGDYDTCGDAISNPTKGSNNILLDNLAAGAYRDFALNATGLTWINKTGVTNLGWREGHDIEDVAFAGGVSKTNGLYCYAADQAGTTTDPKLVVEYTLVSFIPKVIII
jgi:hypothetical protein